MTLSITLSAAAGALVFAAPRLAPWRFLMMIAFLGVIAMLVHAVAIVRTGAR